MRVETKLVSDTFIIYHFVVLTGDRISLFWYYLCLNWQVILVWYCRTLLKQYGKVLGLDPKRIPQNWAATQFAEALGRAWAEYNNDRSALFYAAWVVLFRISRKCKCQLTCFVLFCHSVLLFWWLSNLKKEICTTSTVLSIIWRNHILFYVCFLFSFHSYCQIFNIWVVKNFI